MAGVRALLITPLLSIFSNNSTTHQSSHRGTSHPYFWIIAVGSGIARSPVLNLMDRTGGLVFYLLFFSTWLSAIFLLRYLMYAPLGVSHHVQAFQEFGRGDKRDFCVCWRDVAPAVTTWPDLMGRVICHHLRIFYFFASRHHHHNTGICLSLAILSAGDGL